MKPTTPHDPLDDLIAAALHGELTPAERTQFDARLQSDPAAQAAYKEAQAMHDLLEKTHQSAQPDAAFEQRMVSGVRRKMQSEAHRETAWESALALWKGIHRALSFRYLWAYGGVCSLVLVLALGFVINAGNQVKGVFTTITSQLSMASSGGTINGPIDFNGASVSAALQRHKDLRQEARNQGIHYVESAQKGITLSGYVDTSHLQQFASPTINSSGGLVKTGSGALTLTGGNTYTGATTVSSGSLVIMNGATSALADSISMGSAKGLAFKESATSTTPQGGTVRGSGFTPPATKPDALKLITDSDFNVNAVKIANGNQSQLEKAKSAQDNAAAVDDSSGVPPALPVVAPAEVDDRKLIRNAQLELEVKSFQAAMDQITALTKSAGGYVDTSNSEKGGNGKLHGTVVVKVLPQNLDAFLLKLREVGQVQNQSVSTDDVTKDYIDTQARLENSRRMETQLQDLLKHENSKVADLLAVERELGRVRGEIEQMQGQLKLYDFQVQYATVTMTMSEKDLNQAAAYLLKEQDEFSLFATDVEATFQKARQSADDFKAQVLTANLNHNSGSDVSAELVVMVAPDQIEPFLAQVRGLGRVANFTRQTQRVAKDGGDSSQPADLTATEKDKVQVHLAIRSDDETRKQVALTVVAKAVDTALDQAKAAALANAGVEILSSSLNKTPQGQSTAQLSVRVPGKDYAALIAAFNALGRTASLSIQRNDNSGPGANGDDAPVIVSLGLTDDDAPLQQTELSVATKDVDQQSQQIKKSAAAAGVEVKASSFERAPDGSENAQMTFRLPMAKYAAFLETVKTLGKVESLTVHRDDRPDQTLTDDTAPAEIALQLHSARDFVPDDTGLFATLSNTFGSGVGTLFAALKFIGVVIAFLVPWVLAIGLTAWVARRIYVWRKK